MNSKQKERKGTLKIREINLLKEEAEDLAQIMSTPDQQWEAYLAESFFYRVRPVVRTRSDSIADFVETLLMPDSQRLRIVKPRK